ncbi:MAG TPA: hypothetical protein VFD48_03135 [Pyrinomonadaceae bacterium]|nr:hypothetical protein [Pyrinomonadaceae bacterium]
MSRPTKVGLLVVCAIVVAIFAFIMYEVYVPGETKEVVGRVVGLQQIANKSQPQIRRYAGVKLENGLTVRARVDSHVTLVTGDRAAFLEITTPLLGFKRYRFHRHLDPDRSQPGAHTGAASP